MQSRDCKEEKGRYDTCPDCGGIKRSEAKRCQSCHSKSRIKRPEDRVRATMICHICGKEFRVKNNVKNRGKGLYCSKTCMGVAQRGPNNNLWRTGNVDKQCLHCGKEFSVKYSHRLRAKFCSVECKVKSQIIDSETKRSRVKRTCLSCGVEFTTGKSQADKGQGRYCSLKCMGYGRRGTNPNCDHPNWLNGKSFEPYPVGFNDILKEIVRARDNNTCQLCHSRGRFVHHINYNKNDIRLSNLISLCNKCHSKTNVKNRAGWEAVLSDVMSGKELGGYLYL
jgi:hypothetical protein